MTEARAGGADIDLVRLYLEDIGGVPLLEAHEEVELGQRIEAGREVWLTAVDEGRKLTRKEQTVFLGGLAARDRFIEANLRLVVSIAKKFQNTGVPLLDLIQEGSIGLEHAVEKYDYRKGFKFSTYGSWWIKQALTRGAHENGRVTRMPEHTNIAISGVERARDRLIERLQREPTEEELCEEAGIEDTIKLRQLTSLQNFTNQASLDVIAGEGETDLYNLVRDPHAEDTEDRVTAQSTGERIIQISRSLLSETEFDAYSLMVGLQGPKVSAPEASNITGLKRGRITYILSRMRSIMHHPATGIAAELDESFAWQNDAKCKGEDLKIFFPERGADYVTARNICSGCTNQEACKDLGMSQNHGIWGGESKRSRARARKKVKQEALEKAVA